jgi:hypothetical protein
MQRLFTTVALSALTSLSWAQTYLSPNQLGSGNLPGTHADLIFTLSDGNWTPQVSLPTTAADKASIKIVSNAGYGAQVLQANTDVPLPSMGLSRGQTLHYQYSSARQRWEVVAPTVWAANNGQPLALAAGADRVVRARMADGAWAASLNLPATAIDNALVLVNSTAQWSSRIDPSNVLHASTMPLRTNDAYAFLFNARLGKWVLHNGPETTLAWTSTQQGQMPAPATALTRLNLPVGTSGATVRLPSRAGDRDRIVLTSSADARNTIANTSVQGGGTMTIGKGQSYEFMWNASTNHWVLMQAPRTQVTAQSIRQMMMPALQTPVTELLAWDGNWKPTIALPFRAQAGDRVVAKSSATWSFRVIEVSAISNVDHTVSTGEEVAFVYNGRSWARETDTIRILLSYGQGVTARLGAAAARARQLESLRLTNESLANSGARFRFQVAGLLEVPNLGTTLNDAVTRGRNDPTIQNERNRLLADGVYYEGIEDGCGLAWVNSTPHNYNMLSTGSLNCGTTVMRHELGHNMGLGHGNGVIPTVMSGNAVPYFATPHRFDASLGVAKGHLATVPDEVTPMDRNAPAVSRFR